MKSYLHTKLVCIQADSKPQGIVAALVAVGIFGAKMGTFGAKAPYHLHQVRRNQAPADGNGEFTEFKRYMSVDFDILSRVKALLGELVFTFTLSYVVLGVAVSAVTKAWLCPPLMTTRAI